MNKTAHLIRHKQIKTKKNMKTKQKKKNSPSNSADSGKNQIKRISLWNRIEVRNTLSMYEMTTILQEIQVRYLESMDKYELLRLTREMLYLKYAIGLMRRNYISELAELWCHGLGSDFAFTFKMGRMYPNGVAVMYEDNYNCTDNTQMIKDFIAELSPYLNEAEQMLFKFAICEENFNPETDED
jgi:hypothetical protein